MARVARADLVAANRLKEAGQMQSRPPMSVHELIIDKFRTVDPITREPVSDASLDALHTAMVKARRLAEEIARLPDEVLADTIFSRKTNIEKLRSRVKALVNDAAHGLDDAAVRATAERDRVRTKIATRGPAMLSGMSDMERELRRAEWQRQEHPVELNRIERLSKAIEAADRASRAVRSFADQVVSMKEDAA
jgi:hypothetical protein